MGCKRTVIRNDTEDKVRDQIIKSLVSLVKKSGNGKSLQSCNQGNDTSISLSLKEHI